MIAFIVSILITAATVVAAWKLDQGKFQCQTPLRAFVSVVLLALGTWVTAIIFLSLQLKVPGAYGPVQFWAGSEEAHYFILGARVLALFCMLAGVGIAAVTVIATLVSLFIEPFERRFHRLALPAVAFSVFGMAVFSFGYYGFYPRA